MAVIFNAKTNKMTIQYERSSVLRRFFPNVTKTIPRTSLAVALENAGTYRTNKVIAINDVSPKDLQGIAKTSDKIGVELVISSIPHEQLWLLSTGTAHKATPPERILLPINHAVTSELRYFEEASVHTHPKTKDNPTGILPSRKDLRLNSIALHYDAVISHWGITRYKTLTDELTDIEKYVAEQTAKSLGMEKRSSTLDEYKTALVGADIRMPFRLLIWKRHISDEQCPFHNTMHKREVDIIFMPWDFYLSHYSNMSLIESVNTTKDLDKIRTTFIE